VDRLSEGGEGSNRGAVALGAAAPLLFEGQSGVACAGSASAPPAGHPITRSTAWSASPASEPTTVPLMRMN
jgi:hypothetical protein